MLQQAEFYENEWKKMEMLFMNYHVWPLTKKKQFKFWILLFPS